MTDLRKLLDEATDGPWEAAIEAGCHGVTGAPIEAGRAVFVAIVANDPATPEREPVRFANARLMAMAPDLAKRVLELEDAFAGCLRELVSVYRSEFDGAWAEEDFDKIQRKYDSVLKGSDT